MRHQNKCWKKWALLLALLVPACTVTVNDVQIHPPLVEPIPAVCDVEWTLGVDSSGEDIIGLSISDGVKYRACLSGVVSYIQKQQESVQFYRAEMEEVSDERSLKPP